MMVKMNRSDQNEAQHLAGDCTALRKEPQGCAEGHQEHGALMDDDYRAQICAL